MASSFTLDLSDLKRKVAAAPDKLDRAVFAAVEYQRSPAQSWMRTNARWTDRTSNARNGLFASANHIAGKRHELILYHSMPYGIWLEVRWSGRYAIIEPALRNQGPALMSSLQNIMKEIV